MLPRPDRRGRAEGDDCGDVGAAEVKGMSSALSLSLYDLCFDPSLLLALVALTFRRTRGLNLGFRQRLHRSGSIGVDPPHPKTPGAQPGLDVATRELARRVDDSWGAPIRKGKLLGENFSGGLGRGETDQASGAVLLEGSCSPLPNRRDSGPARAPSLPPALLSCVAEEKREMKRVSV